MGVLNALLVTLGIFALAGLYIAWIYGAVIVTGERLIPACALAVLPVFVMSWIVFAVVE
jgi:hypothetical protein